MNPTPQIEYSQEDLDRKDIELYHLRLTEVEDTINYDETRNSKILAYITQARYLMNKYYTKVNDDDKALIDDYKQKIELWQQYPKQILPEIIKYHMELTKIMSKEYQPLNI